MRKADRIPRIWSPKARQDLFDIWSYVAIHGSSPVADKQLHEIDRVCFALGGWPEYGKVRDDVRQGLRSVPASRYVIFYRVTKTAVEIVRVLDERRDVDVIFQEGK